MVTLGRMKIASVLAPSDDAELLATHLAFHLSAGVDLVLVTDDGVDSATWELLESYERDGLLQRVREEEVGGGDPRTRLARLAVTDHGADWVLSSDADEFWWPRGESLRDVLAAMPRRYGVIQGLVRVFPPRAGEGPFFERMTARPSLLDPQRVREPLASALRPVYRADPELVIDPEDATEGGRRVPLRAWYPVEVLRFPFRTLEQTERFCGSAPRPRSQLEADALEAHRAGRLADWYAAAAGEDASLVPDERLRDAVRTLAAPGASSAPGAKPFPGADGGLVLRPPTIVDDAAYAGECAALGEADLGALDAHIRELEARIAALEARFWPRVARRLSRLARR